MFHVLKVLLVHDFVVFSVQESIEKEMGQEFYDAQNT